MASWSASAQDASTSVNVDVLVNLYSREISVIAIPDSIIVVELRRDGLLRARSSVRIANSKGRTPISLAPISGQEAVFLMPGDHLDIVANGNEVAATDLPEFFADYQQIERRLNGLAPPGMQVHFAILRPDPADRPPRSIDLGTAMADQTGQFVMDWPLTATLLAGDQGVASILTAEGTEVRTQYAAFSVQPVVGENVLFGQASLGSNITVELTKQSGVTVGDAISGSVISAPRSQLDWRIDLGGTTGRIEPGDRITISQRSGGRILQQISRKVPALSIDVDLSQGLISGTAPPGATLALSAARVSALRVPAPAPPFSQGTTATSAGSYQVRVLPTSLKRGWNVLVTLVEPGSLRFQAEVVLRLVKVLLYGESIEAYVGYSNRTVTATILAGDGKAKFLSSTRTDLGGGFVFSLRNSLDTPGRSSLEPGDRIEIAVADQDPMLMTVPIVTARYDSTAQVVSGLAPFGTTLRVTRGTASNEAALLTSTDVDGAYNADVSGLGTMPGGPGDAAGFVVATSPFSGYEFYLPWSAITLFLSLEAESIAGTGPVGRRVRVEALDDGGREIATAVTIADGDGALNTPNTQWRAALHDAIGRGVEAGRWRRLRVTAGDDQLDWVLPPLMGTISLVDNSVSGRSLPNANIAVRFSRSSGDTRSITTREKDVRVESSGEFHLGASPEWTLRTGDQVGLSFYSSEGHRIARKLHVPSVEVAIDRSQVIGFISPAGNGQLLLVRPDQSQNIRAISADAEGRYRTVFSDAQGNLLPILSRFVLRVTDNSAPSIPILSTEVPTLTLEIDEIGKLIRGQAQPGASLGIEIGTNTVRYGQDAYGAIARATAPLTDDGSYFLPLSQLTPDSGWPGSPGPTGVRVVPGQHYRARLAAIDGNAFSTSRVIPIIDITIGGALTCIIGEPRAAVNLSLRSGEGTLLGTANGTTDDQGKLKTALRGKDNSLLRTAVGHVLSGQVGQDSIHESISPAELSVMWDIPRSGGIAGTRLDGKFLPILSQAYASIGLRVCDSMLSDRQTTLIDSWSTTSGEDGRLKTTLGNARPGQIAQLSFYGPNGNLFSLWSRRLLAIVLVNTARVRGAGPPQSEVEVALSRPGAGIIASDRAVSDEEGNFAATLHDELGNMVSSRATDSLVVSATGQAATIGVERLDFDYSTTTGLMANLPASRPIQVDLTISDGRTFSVEGISGADGRYVLNSTFLPADVDWTLDDVAQIRLTMETFDGHLIRAEATRQPSVRPTPAPMLRRSQLYVPLAWQRLLR